MKRRFSELISVSSHPLRPSPNSVPSHPHFPHFPRFGRQHFLNFRVFVGRWKANNKEHIEDFGGRCAWEGSRGASPRDTWDVPAWFMRDSTYQKSREGGVRKGGGVVAQICRKLRAKFARNCWYFVSDSTRRVRKIVSQMALQRCNVNFLVRFLGWILEGEFWEVNFSRVNFSGGLFCWKKQSQKNRPKNSGPKFGHPKFVSQNSGQNSGSGGAKSPVQTFVPEKLSQIRKSISDNKAFSSKRGLFFAVKGPRALPKFHTHPPPGPSPQKGVTENPSRGSPKRGGRGRGWGGGGSVWNLGSARGPFTAKKAPFRWKRLQSYANTPFPMTPSRNFEHRLDNMCPRDRRDTSTGLLRSRNPKESFKATF